MSKSKEIKAAFIDPSTGVVEIVTIDMEGEDSYKRINEKLGCEFFTCVTLSIDEVSGVSTTLYCDDTGLVTGGDDAICHVRLGNIYGKCLIMGTDPHGEPVDTTIKDLFDLAVEGVYSCANKESGLKKLVMKE